MGANATFILIWVGLVAVAAALIIYWPTGRR